MTRRALGEFEQQVLLTLLRLGGEAYSVPVVTTMEERSGREVSQAAVYIALRRLEEKGLVSSRMAQGETTESGRERRYFRIQPEGLELLREARLTMARYWEGLEGLLGGRGEHRSPARAPPVCPGGCAGCSESSWTTGNATSSWGSWRSSTSPGPAASTTASRTGGTCASSAAIRSSSWGVGSVLGPPVPSPNFPRSDSRCGASRAPPCSRARSCRPSAWRSEAARRSSPWCTPCSSSPCPTPIPSGWSGSTPTRPPTASPFSVVDFQALEAQQPSFDEIGAYRPTTRTLATGEGAELLRLVEATPGLLELWGVRPLAGRLPTAREGAADAAPTALVTAGFARRHLGTTRSDASDALGRTVSLDGAPHEVIGVLPATLGPLARGVEVVPTLRLQPPSRKGPFFLHVFGRLRLDTDPEAALAELHALNARLFPLWADSYQDRRATWGMAGVEELVRRDARRLLPILMGAVAMVLLVAAANGANLLLARVSARTRELAV